MGDQTEGIIRDSDIKFECRMLLATIQNIGISEEQINMVLEPISNIVRIENDRLEALHRRKHDK